MSQLISGLRQDLTDKNLSLQDFSAIAQRLMEYGVIHRDENQTEANLFDQAVRIKGVLVDYFSASGLILRVDESARYLRLYPPAATVPGMLEEETGSDRNMRAKLDSDTVATVLALAFLYRQGVLEGRMQEGEEVNVTLEDLVTAMETQIKWPLPATREARREIFKTLKAQRLIRTSPELSENTADAGISVRRAILGFVSDSAVEAAVAAAAAVPQLATATTPEEQVPQIAQVATDPWAEGDAPEANTAEVDNKVNA